MRLLTIVLGVLGLAVALAGVWSHFATWLNLLGIFVPPIGAVLIIDQLVRRRTAPRAVSQWRVQPFLAWALGSLAAYAVHVWASQLSEAVAGILVGALAYSAIEAFTPRPATRLAAPPATEPVT